MSAPLTQRLVEIAQAAQSLRKGEKQALYASACEELQMSLATLHRKLKQVAVRNPRKRRADAGDVALSRNEAELISGYLMEHIRRNGKRIKAMERAISELRANGKLVAGRIDEDTGEFFPLSVSAIRRALWSYGLHPDQLMAPAPVTPLASEHPNDVWQIDASLCVLYKLPRAAGTRIEEIAGHELYKNKLGNLARIEHLLVQRYVIADHASGAIYLHFALGGESTDGLLSALIAAMIERPGYAFHGAPNLIMLDQASANRSAMFRNLCKALSIKLHFTMVGNPRSKGLVEKSHDLVESGFESGLKCAPPISDVDELNRLGWQWMHWFNGTAKHTRHGMTRYAAWQLITEAQLRRVTLSPDELRVLAREEPVEKPVTAYLTVNFKGKEYDVSKVPGVMVGQKLLICRCALMADFAQVVQFDAEGHEVFLRVEEKRREGPFQFYAEAARIGQEYKRHEDTPAQTAKKEIEKQVTGTDTLEAAEAARKNKVVPYGGEINPYKEMQEYQPPTWLRKRGTDLQIAAPTVELIPLNPIQAAKWLRARLGDDWRPEHLQQIQREYPDGVPETELPALAERLSRGETRQPKLAIVK